MPDPGRPPQVTAPTSGELERKSHQAQHILKRDHDVSEMTGAELERARRELEASLTLARPGSITSVPIMAQIAAIDAALAGLKRPTDATALPGSPLL